MKEMSNDEWDRQFRDEQTGERWGLRAWKENGQTKLKLARFGDRVRGESGVLWEQPCVALNGSIDFLQRVIQECREIVNQRQLQQRAKKVLDHAMGQSVQRQSDLRYGIRENAIVTPHTLEGISKKYNCEIDLLRLALQDYVEKSILAVDAFNRLVVYQPEHFYQAWAY